MPHTNQESKHGYVVQRLSNALFESDLISIRLTLSLAELCWAIMLLMPGDTFDRPTYAIMRALGPEWVWTIIFALSAALQFTIVLTGNFKANWARTFAMWNAALWVFSVFSMLMSVYPPPAAIGGEIALMIAAVWIWVRPLIVEHGAMRCLRVN